eukprot:TRINITY_DN818_c0_g1_i1.p1 TRINITY_DN818_c0_g1~~TRINITY_DN818_c0_g1_i1.p1  ORF type:complete len:117 (+),score=31.98 TRINITY_DN818_c0_g1_i1:75-425(+)
MERDKEVLVELQTKIIEANQKLSQVRGQLNRAERERRRNELTLAEVIAQPEETPLYSAVGKMFILTPREKLTNSIRTEIVTLEGELQQLYQSRTYLTKQASNAEAQMKEIARSHAK